MLERQILQLNHLDLYFKQNNKPMKNATIAIINFEFIIYIFE